MCTFEQKEKHARAAGALAVLVGNNHPGPIDFFLPKPSSTEAIPIVVRPDDLATVPLRHCATAPLHHCATASRAW